MNFIKWLANRAFNAMFSDWDWIREYRKLIVEIWPLAVILTLLVGGVWFIVVGLTVTWLSGTPPSQFTLKCILAVPPTVFFYNWIAILYEIYDEERQRAWRLLKEKQ
jgi:hypothetical protein